MELPKSKWEFLVQGGKFALRVPFLYLSHLRSHPINVFPLSVDMNITDRCNFRCKHCQGTIEDYKPREEIGFVTMRRVIDDMAEMHIPYLTLGGGEPLLRYDFVLQTIEYAKALGIKVGMVTNSSLLSKDKLVELVETGLHRITFPLDGADKETHDWIRMPGSFDKIMSNLTIGRDLKQEKNFRLHINTVVMRQNFRQLVAIAHIAQKFSATAFYQPVGIPPVNPFQNGTLSPSTGVEAFIINGEELSYLEPEIGKLIDFKKRHGVIGNLIWQLENIVSYNKSLQAERSLINFKCYAGFNTIRLESDGQFGSCIFKPSVGNIQNVSLMKAWLGQRYDNHRRLIKQCTRPCALLCYYPVSLISLTYEFLYLPIRWLTPLVCR